MGRISHSHEEPKWFQTLVANETKVTVLEATTMIEHKDKGKEAVVNIEDEIDVWVEYIREKLYKHMY